MDSCMEIHDVMAFIGYHQNHVTLAHWSMKSLIQIRHNRTLTKEIACAASEKVTRRFSRIGRCVRYLWRNRDLQDGRKSRMKGPSIIQGMLDRACLFCPVKCVWSVCGVARNWDFDYGCGIEPRAKRVRQVSSCIWSCKKARDGAKENSHIWFICESIIEFAYASFQNSCACG